jgi:hypothetical protein
VAGALVGEVAISILDVVVVVVFAVSEFQLVESFFFFFWLDRLRVAIRVPMMLMLTEDCCRRCCGRC